MSVVHIPREPLTRRQRLTLAWSPEHLGVALLPPFIVGLIVGIVLLITGTWVAAAVMLTVGLAAATLLAVGATAEQNYTAAVSTENGLAIHVQNGVKAWRALPSLLRAETLPVLSGLYAAGVVASREPYAADLRKRVVDRVLLLQKIGQAHERTDEVARRQAAALARGTLDDTDLADGDYTLTVLREGLRALDA